MPKKSRSTCITSVFIVAILAMAAILSEAFIPLLTATPGRHQYSQQSILQSNRNSLFAMVPKQGHSRDQEAVVGGNETTTPLPTSSNPTDEDVASRKERAVIMGLEQILQDEEPTRPSSVDEPVSITGPIVEVGDSTKYVGVSPDDIHNDPALRILSSELGVKQFLGEPTDDAAVAQAIMMERTMDTLEDIVVHLRRLPIEFGLDPTGIEENRKTIVVLGSGWAAHALIKVADCCKIRLIVVSPSNHFVFTPMLASVRPGCACSTYGA